MVQLTVIAVYETILRIVEAKQLGEITVSILMFMLPALFYVGIAVTETPLEQVVCTICQR